MDSDWILHFCFCYLVVPKTLQNPFAYATKLISQFRSTEIDTRTLNVGDVIEIEATREKDGVVDHYSCIIEVLQPPTGQMTLVVKLSQLSKNSHPISVQLQGMINELKVGQPLTLTGFGRCLNFSSVTKLSLWEKEQGAACASSVQIAERTRAVMVAT